MKYEFRKDIITHIPTCCLVEDYQTLLYALESGNHLKMVGAIKTTLECLAETIDRYTTIPDGLHVVPSPSSIIAMGQESGIIVNGSEDIKCADGKPVSNAMAGGCCQCCEQCRFFQKGCDPEHGLLLLKSGFLYDGAAENEDSLLESLNLFPEDGEN